jgi:hypothetical protein
MKKLLYLFLTVLIVACSSDDGNDGTTLTSQFVGSWLEENSSEESSLTLEFNADGTGSSIEFYDGDTDTEVFSWSSTSTQLTVTFAPDDVDVLQYEFITKDQLRLSYEDDDTGIIFAFTFNRIAD